MLLAVQSSGRRDACPDGVKLEKVNGKLRQVLAVVQLCADLAIRASIVGGDENDAETTTIGSGRSTAAVNIGLCVAWDLTKKKKKEKKGSRKLS